jgi:NADPH-dependent curcumin reductase CurA
MATRNSTEVHLKARPDGIPDESCFRFVKTEVPDAGPGDVLVRNVYMSLDPAMRPPLTNGQQQLDHVLGGSAIGRVEQSQNQAFAEGDFVQSRRGWREYFVSDGQELQIVRPEGVPLTAYLGVLGGTGLTAYGGLLVTGELKDGETVFVSAAAGAVGSVAGQIARIKDCRVIGSCGSDEKVRWLMDELGFDYAFNYRKGHIRRELRSAVPDGIDVYFENVGGDHLDAALGRMRPGGRIPVCGMISAYNNEGARSEGVTALANMIYNRVTMKGFIATEFLGIRDQFLADMRRWLAEGKIVNRETIFEGIENAPAALAGLFTGANIGKMLVRLSSED